MTFTMTALAHPSSTNLTVPTSQNTAPVLSFSCLYTHDIRRKQKRWQDGILRFHTFNKRIMVYDTPRNFIGDTHWRETQAIQDGDELELEKGVLIQVGEEVERTETDLTGLLEKRTPKHPAGRDRQPSPSTFQTTGIGQRNSTPRHSTFETHPETPFAQLRPKSLNALLGKPRGPVGKAVVTVKSPADLRKEKENGFGLYASSSKRRRVDYPTTAMPTMRLPTDRVDLSGEPLEKARNPASKARGSSSASRGGTNVASEAPQRPRNPATSEGHVSNVKRQPKEPQGSNGRSNGIPSHITQASNTTDGDHARSRAKKPRRGQQIDGLLAPSGTAKSKKRREATSESLSRDGFQDNIALEDSEPRGIQVDDEPRPEHMLRILSRKPRKKLLYRDLLPQKAAPHQNLRTPDGQSRRETRQRTTASRSAVGKRLEDPLDAYHQAQQSRLQTRLTKRITGILPGQQSLRYVGNENHIPSIEKTPSPILNPEPTFPDSLFLTQPSPPPPKHPPTPLSEPSYHVPTSTQAARTLTRMDALLLQRPPEPIAAPQHKPSPPPGIIKAALPPPRMPARRPPQRPASDLSTCGPGRSSSAGRAATDDDRLVKHSTATLRNSLSDPTPTLTLDPPAGAPTHPSILYRSAAPDFSVDNPPFPAPPRQHSAEPWSKEEAWDLFAFLDGGDKRIVPDADGESRRGVC